MAGHDLLGFLRPDGRKGVRNVLLVAYLVECARHVAHEIALPFHHRGVHLIGFGGCYPNPYAEHMLRRLCTHSNVGGVLLISLGCESFDRHLLRESIRQSGRPADTLVIQKSGGTRKTIEAGRSRVEELLEVLGKNQRVPLSVAELIVGTICGGSDATSGITANPAIGRAFDQLGAEGAACIFEETGELIGCEEIMAARAASTQLGEDLRGAVRKAARYYAVLGHGSFAPGNAEGGLTTQEEKSMGAYCKSGMSPIAGILRPGDLPPRGGLYLLDIIPDGEVRFGFPNINDNAEIAELIACGCQMILFSTGRGTVVGSAISPVIKVCAHPETYRNLSDDMDIDAGQILENRATLDEIGEEIYRLTRRVAGGEATKSESLGHQEFVLTYKNMEPAGASCRTGGGGIDHHD